MKPFFLSSLITYILFFDFFHSNDMLDPQVPTQLFSSASGCKITVSLGWSLFPWDEVLKLLFWHLIDVILVWNFKKLK